MAELKSTQPDQVSFDEQIHDQLVAHAVELGPLLDEHARDIEEGGRLSDEVLEEIDRAGFCRMAVPQRLGGLGASGHTIASVTSELAKHCPSTAWVMCAYNSGGWMVTKGSTAFQETVYQHGLVRVCATFSGMGQLSPEGNGYRFRGQWAYASGCRHADWAMASGLTEDGKIFMVAVPISELRIENSWIVAGMQGTGSDTLVAEDVFVLKEQLLPFEDVSLRGVHGQDGSDYWSFIPFLRAKALGVLVGTVEGLLNTVMEGAERPIVYSTFQRKSDSATYLAGIGSATAKINCARTIMDRLIQNADQTARTQSQPTEAERAGDCGDTAVAVDLLAQASDKLMDLAGSSSFQLSNRAQLFWRDFAVFSRHVTFNRDVSYEVLGRQRLNVEPNVMDLERF